VTVVADVVNVDLPAVCETLRYFAECIDKVEGSVTNSKDYKKLVAKYKSGS